MTSGGWALIFSGSGAMLVLTAVLVTFPSNSPGTTVRGGNCTFHGELAASGEAQEKGMTGRAEVLPDFAMIFPLNEARPTSFWMRNTPVPLSIVFVARDGMVLSMADMQPESFDLVPSPQGAVFAIEMAQGRPQSCGIQIGSRVDVITKVDEDAETP